MNNMYIYADLDEMVELNKQKARNKKQYIYVLREKDRNEVRYVGRSIRPLQRYSADFTERGPSTPKRQWFLESKERGTQIVLEIIEECDSLNGARREEYWIDFYRKLGHRVTNTRRARMTPEEYKTRNRQKYKK